MITLKKILVPTCFCKGSKAAYDYAEAFAETFGGTIDFIHVVPTLKYFNESLKKVGYPFSLENDLYPKVTADAKEKAKKDQEKFISEEHRGEVFVKIAPKASEAILEQSKKNDYDLIIMGTRSEDPLDVILGSTTEKVIRYSTVPVLTTPPKAKVDEINTILVPTDYSDRSMMSIRPAIRIASSLNASVTLLHVRELYGSDADNDPQAKGGESDQDIEVRLANKLEGYFSSEPDFEARLEGSTEGDMYTVHFELNKKQYKVPLKIDVTRGISAHYEIVDYAENNADLICITTHGRSGLASLFLGSTTEKVIKWSKIPVMITRTVMYKRKQ